MTTHPALAGLRLHKGRLIKPGENATAKAGDPISNIVQLKQAARYSELPDYDPNESDEQIRSKLKERFEIADEMTREIIDGDIRALIISGPGGVGKTFGVEKQFDEWDPEGVKHTRSKGYMRATGLWRLLYQHRSPEGRLVFDDADTIYFDETSLNLLKVALDTTSVRRLSWGSETIFTDEESGDPIPRSFEFEGAVQFITNLDFDAQIARGSKLTPHLEALITRSHYLDMGMKTKRDYLMRVYMVCEEGMLSERGLTIEEENDVLEFLEENSKILREMSLRMAIKVAHLRQSRPEKWKRMALLTCCKGIR